MLSTMVLGTWGYDDGRRLVGKVGLLEAAFRSFPTDVVMDRPVMPLFHGCGLRGIAASGPG